MGAVYSAQNQVFGQMDYPFLTEIIERHGVKRILDVGTGDGSFLLGLAQRLPSLEYDGIDLNESLIVRANENNRNLGLSVNFRHANFKQGFTNERYDLLIARFAVEHIVNLEDIQSFMNESYEVLNIGSHILIIEYYVHALDIIDATWAKFRQTELVTYNEVKAHPRIALKLPKMLANSGFSRIRSSINHVSPGIVGKKEFFNLIMEYAKIYSLVDPVRWNEELLREIFAWCNSEEPDEEPVLFSSYTIGRKSF